MFQRGRAGDAPRVCIEGAVRNVRVLVARLGPESTDALWERFAGYFIGISLTVLLFYMLCLIGCMLTYVVGMWKHRSHQGAGSMGALTAYKVTPRAGVKTGDIHTYHLFRFHIYL